jgi:signal peptidase II
MLPMRNRYYLVALLILLFDHLTKWIVRAKLSPELPVEIIPGYLRLSYWENSGVAFGLFNDVVSFWKPYILAAMAIVAVLVIVIYGMHMPAGRKLLQLSLAIMIGGILGNFADRIIRGYVVDFIDFHIHESFYWPTFNVADSAITIGIALLLIDTIKSPVDDKVAQQPATDGRQ